MHHHSDGYIIKIIKWYMKKVKIEIVEIQIILKNIQFLCFFLIKL